MKKWVAGLAILIVLAILTVAPATAQTFDNSGGSSWKEYMSFPITTTPTEYAQYKIVINGTTWELYNVTGSLEASGTNDNFWSLVNSTSADIRVFNQNYNQLYFWVEKWDYANKTAVIWVKVEAGVSELNIAYGNPSATKSDYEDGEQVFEFFDDFENLNKWTISSGSPTTKTIDSVTVVELSGGTIESPILTTESGNFKFKTRWKWLNSPDGTISTRAQYGVFDDGRVDGIMGAMSGLNDDLVVNSRLSDSWQSEASVVSTSSVNTWYRFEIDKNGDSYTVRFYSDDDSLLGSTTRTVVDADLYIEYSVQSSQTVQIDWVFVAKLADPADFGTPLVKLFQNKFGTKTVYVNVTYLDTAVTERYNPTAYYKLEDKPQINVTSQLSISGVNATDGANISIELIDFVTLDKVVYNGTEVSVTYQGTVTNSTTGYVYNVYNFTTYENGTLEIYGHVGNKAYETTFKLDGETVDVFNVTVVVGEALEITLPHRGNVTLASTVYTEVTSVLINTKDIGVGAKTLSITIDDPENFTVGYVHRTVNIDWGKIYFNVTDLQNKTLARTTYGLFNKNFSIISTDPTKLYAGDIEIDVYFHGVKLKSLEIYLNHTNNGLTLNVSVNATQLKDYRNVTRIIASPNCFEVVNLSTKYPFSVMKLANVSGTIVVDYVSNAPTSVEVEGATSYTYEKPVLKITVSSNVTVTDLYRLSTPLKDRLGNPANFYVLINGSRVDASAGKASKLLKPSWYEVEVPITVSGFELWKFNDSSNIALVEINASDKTLPTAEYRVPSKIETKEVRIQKTKFPWLPFPFLSESKPAQEETPIVRLEGTLRDFYNAPVANKIVRIEVASPNFTRIYSITTDSSGNFKIDVDMVRGVEYKVIYRFTGDDIYVGTSTTKTFYIEELPIVGEIPIETPMWIIATVIVVATIGAIVAIIYLSKKQRAVTRARIEDEFRFFRRLK